MQVSLAFKDDEARAHEAAITKRFERDRRRLDRLLTRYRDDLAVLRLTFESLGRDGRLHGRAVLQLPTGTLATDADGRDACVIVDELVDEIRKKLARHRELVRKDWTYRRKQRQREGVQDAEAALRADRAAGRREAFAELLCALIAHQEPRIVAELGVLVAAGKIPPGRISWTDVRDEVVARAWDRFDQRPQDVPLDLWLHGLFDEVMAELAERELDSLEFRSLVPGADTYGPARGIDPEVPALEDAILGELEGEAWAELRIEDLRVEIEKALGDQPPARRRAFLAHLFDGLDLAEIALVQGRSEVEVRADVEAAREAVKARLARG